VSKTPKVVRKNMRLRQDLIDQARKILGTRTETETVEQALELVTFREEVLAGIESIAGTHAVEDVFRDGHP
jgi:hypothetical protein